MAGNFQLDHCNFMVLELKFFVNRHQFVLNVPTPQLEMTINSYLKATSIYIYKKRLKHPFNKEGVVINREDTEKWQACERVDYH